MPDEMNVSRLIAEVKNRPTLWDVHFAEYKDRTNTALLWQEIADILCVDVELCKRKWKNLRDAYRAEVRRNERRQERQRILYPNKCMENVVSKWVYFEPMSFINDTRRFRHAISVCGGTSTAARPAAATNSAHDAKLHTFCDIKAEPHHTTDEDDEEDDDMLFQEFQNLATPQAARRLSSSMAHVPEEEIGVVNEASCSSDCGNKSNKRTDDQVHFLENLEREEENLMWSTRQDMSRSNNLAHVGDSDYNFLVSFLPQMKKMSELQNLQFRAKMSELLLNIMSPTMMTTQSQPVLLVQPQPLALPMHCNQNVMAISNTTTTAPMQSDCDMEGSSEAIPAGTVQSATMQSSQLQQQQQQQQQQQEQQQSQEQQIQMLESDLMGVEQAE